MILIGNRYFSHIKINSKSHVNSIKLCTKRNLKVRSWKDWIYIYIFIKYMQNYYNKVYINNETYFLLKLFIQRPLHTLRHLF